MSKHTPGPWRWETSKHGSGCDCWMIGQDEAEHPIAIITSDAPGDGESNARLIAAAPDLLEACEMALSAVGPLGTVSECKRAGDQLRAAINKARGEQ